MVPPVLWIVAIWLSGGQCLEAKWQVGVISNDEQCSFKWMPTFRGLSVLGTVRNYSMKYWYGLGFSFSQFQDSPMLVVAFSFGGGFSRLVVTGGKQLPLSFTSSYQSIWLTSFKRLGESVRYTLEVQTNDLASFKQRIKPGDKLQMWTLCPAAEINTLLEPKSAKVPFDIRKAGGVVDLRKPSKMKFTPVWKADPVDSFSSLNYTSRLYTIPGCKTVKQVPCQFPFKIGAHQETMRACVYETDMRNPYLPGYYWCPTSVRPDLSVPPISDYERRNVYSCLPSCPWGKHEGLKLTDFEKLPKRYVVTPPGQT